MIIDDVKYINNLCSVEERIRGIFRKAKGAREARKETLTLELNANVS
jgi:hypothetical protein